MRNPKGRLVPAAVKSQDGFTLVELLVVVAIIVALAAVIVPNVTKFASKGKEGALAAEADSVQSAMDSMMADQGITAVTANTGGAATSVADFSTLPPEGPLTGYLRQNPTQFFYCWGSDGLVTAQFETAQACP